MGLCLAAGGRDPHGRGGALATMATAGSQPKQGLAAYAVVTAAYWTFMLTDGALRMLVLLH